MINILIVDDVEDNRLVIKLLLEDYMQENADVKINIDEASDGTIAVEKCKNNEYDIVFMDIQMPVMDGIEATKAIRSYDNKIMIIAVSALDDEKRQKQILNNGAEDYIFKPINADIFLERVSYYIKLIRSRAAKKDNSAEINLFTSEIYSRHTKFIVTSEDSLSEFWEFFLLNARAKYDNLSDLIRALFVIAEEKLQLSVKSEIYLEEDDFTQYFTIVDIHWLTSETIEKTARKCGLEYRYDPDQDKISFVLPKIISEAEDEIRVSSIVNTVVSQESSVSPSVGFTSSKELIVFDYMDSDDLYDLEEYAGKLNSIMLLVGSGGVSEDEVVDIYTNLDRISSILATYSEVYDISKALAALSADMSSHMQEFIDNSEALGPMCKAFSNDMSNWIEKSFHTGAPSADFMNDTISVNCQTISGMLKMDEASADGGDDFDDIFDF